MRNLIIVGAGGFGREILAWARDSADAGRHWRVRGFLDDNDRALWNRDVGVPVLDRIADYEPRKNEVFVCAIGQPKLRRQVFEQLVRRGAEFATLVHPTAVVAERAKLGAGVIVCPFALVSVDARVGVGAAIYYHSSVDHDAVVGEYSQISAHCDITGGARVGKEVFMGSHASVLPGVNVGDRAVIGAGAVVTKDVLPGVTVTGVPARRRLGRSR